MSARFAAIALLATLAASPAGAAGPTPDWPMFGHDAAHRSLSPVVGAQVPTLNWKSATRTYSAFDYLPDPREFSPVVGGDGSVYYADLQGVVALNADGSLRWVHPLADAEMAVALGPDGVVYAGHAGGLRAVNPDGSLRWDFAAGMPLRWPVVSRDGRIVASSPAVAGKRTLGAGALFVIDANGHELKRVRVPGGPTATPALTADRGLVVPALQCTRWRWYDQELLCVKYQALLDSVRQDAGGLRVIFTSHEGPESRFSSPSIGRDGTIYLAGTVGTRQRLFALDAEGHPLWSKVVDCCDVSAPAIGPDGTLYVETLGGNEPKAVHAITPDGKLRWRRAFPDGIEEPRRPAVGADGMVYAGLVDGVVHALAPADGAVVWTKALNRGARLSAPAIAPDGSVVLLDSLFDSGPYEYSLTVRAIGPGPAAQAGR